jgi:hypothetical protein
MCAESNYNIMKPSWQAPPADHVQHTVRGAWGTQKKILCAKIKEFLRHSTYTT